LGIYTRIGKLHISRHDNRQQRVELGGHNVGVVGRLCLQKNEEQ
jgi:hypothetical protein